MGEIALLVHVAPISDARDDSFGFWFDLVGELEISLALLLRLANSTLIVAAKIVVFYAKQRVSFLLVSFGVE